MEVCQNITMEKHGPPPIKAKPKVINKPVVAEKPKVTTKTTIQDNKFLNELTNVISKQQNVDKQFDEVAPVSEKTCSLTEVSSLLQSKSEINNRHPELSDTLDFTLSDEGFDVSPCNDQFNTANFDIPQFSLNGFHDEDISEAQFSENDIDDFLNDLSIPPPPPPELDELSIPPPPPPELYENDIDESCDIFIPPAPPPDLDGSFGSSDENDVSQPSAFNDNHMNIKSEKPSTTSINVENNTDIDNQNDFKTKNKSDTVQSKLSEILRSGLNERSQPSTNNVELEKIEHERQFDDKRSKELSSDFSKFNFNESLSNQTSFIDNASEDISSPSTVRRRKNSTISRTWSSCSSASDLESKKDTSVNLRKMFLKNMGSYDSDVDDIESTMEDKKLKRPSNFPKEIETDEDVDGDVDDDDEDDYARLNNIDVTDWNSNDVGDWLELIGLQHLRDNFQGASIDGKTLFDLEYNLLDSLVPNEDEKELLLSEVYTLKNPEHDADFEMSMLEALDESTGEDREKILAMMSTLQQPSAASSPYGNGFLRSGRESALSFETQRAVSPKLKVTTPTINIENEVPNHENREISIQVKGTEENKNEQMMNLLAARVFDPDDDVTKTNVPLSPPPQGDLDKRKKKSKKGLFASLRKKGNKKSKANDQNKVLLNQENAKGMISVLWTTLTNNIDIKLLVAMNDTAQEVCKMCLEYLNLKEDFNLYQIVMSKKDRTVENISLTSTECPLMFQWTDLDTYQFELKKLQGHTIMITYYPFPSNHAENITLEISGKTTTNEIISILAKKLSETTHEKYFYLKNTSTGNQVKNDARLLEQPLATNNQHVFELINTSPEKQIEMNQIRKLEEDIQLLRKQSDEFNNLVQEYKSKVENLTLQNNSLQSENLKLQRELETNNNQVKKLELQLKNQDLHHKLQSPTSLSTNREMKLENMTLSTENKHQLMQIEQLESDVNTYKEKCSLLEEEKVVISSRSRKLENINENLKEKCRSLEQSRKVPVTNENSDKMKKLYSENLEYLSQIRNLEEKLAESEANMLHTNHRKEIQDSESVELRDKFGSLQQDLIDKDSKLLEYEYTIQRIERDLRESKDTLEEERRKRKKDNEIKDSFEQKYEDLHGKIESYKKQMTDKEKHLQSMKSQLSKQEKKVAKQAAIQEKEIKNKQDELLFLQSQHTNETKLLDEKIEQLQKMLIDKDMMKKKSEFEYSKKTEEMKNSMRELERKISAKDVIIDRLENKVAKTDLNIASKLQAQEKVVIEKEELIQRLQMKLAKIEKEQAVKAREFSSNMRTKDSYVEKVELRLKKIEEMNRESSWKHDKQISEKDRLLKQVYEDRDREIKDMKSRLRLMEDEFLEKEKRQKDAYKKQSTVKETLESRLKKREKDYKQQKHLLEKLLEIVNNKSPALLHELENSLDENRTISPRRIRSPTSMNGRTNHDWC